MRVYRFYQKFYYGNAKIMARKYLRRIVSEDLSEDSFQLE